MRRIALALAFATLFSLASCKTAKKATDESNVIDSAPLADENTLGDSDSGKAMGLKTIHFPYDSFVLDGTSKETMKSNAQILKDKGSIKIQIEGHCDIRGGVQYNIALGEKRANAIKKYMEDMGIKSDRIATISYGKERLMDQGMTDEAHAKNRRANFVITAR